MAYSSIVGLVILSALVPFVWVTPSWHDIAFGVFIGVASTAGQWIVVLAFRYADASVLAPFSYTQLLWVSILGFLIFGEVPDVWTVTGAAFIVASGLYTAHRERVQAVAASGRAGRAVAERLTKFPAPARSSRWPSRFSVVRGIKTTGRNADARCNLSERRDRRRRDARTEAGLPAWCWSSRWPAASAAPTCTRASTPTAWSNSQNTFPAASRWIFPATSCSATNSAARCSTTVRLRRASSSPAPRSVRCPRC